MAKTLSLLVIAALISVGCAGESRAPAASEASAPVTEAETTSDEDPVVAEGKALFSGTAICYTCHGAAGEGSDFAPNLTDDEWLNIEPPADIEKLVALIKVGVPKPKQYPGMMPPMGHLTDDQLGAVATYVLSLSNS
ncbi:MAG: cytochrome c [Bacteroidota bacterium]